MVMSIKSLCLEMHWESMDPTESLMHAAWALAEEQQLLLGFERDIAPQRITIILNETFWKTFQNTLKLWLGM